MEQATLARPYAKAAFEYAERTSALEVWQTWLEALSQALCDPKIKGYVTHPAVVGERFARCLIDAMGLTLEDKRANFVRLLAERRRLSLLPEIVILFSALKAAKEQVVTVQLKTVSPLLETLKKPLINALKNRLGCEITLEHEIDPSLIGGAVVRVGDLVIDGSVRGKLFKLSEQLLK